MMDLNARTLLNTAEAVVPGMIEAQGRQDRHHRCQCSAPRNGRDERLHCCKECRHPFDREHVGGIARV